MTGAAAIETAGPASRRATRPVRRWLVAIKLVLVVVGLGLLIRWALGGLGAAGASPALAGWSVAAAVALNQAALLAAALRLRATLAAFGVRIGRWQALAIHLRSLFYFFFVPLSVGLEISRFIDIRRIDADVPARRLILVLLLDRLLGLFAAVIAVVALAGLALPATIWGQLDPRWLLATLGLLVIAGVGVLAHGGLRRRLSGLLGLAQAGSARLLVPLGLSVLALALVCLSVWVVAAGSGWDAGLAPVAFALSVSLLAMALPLSLFGATLGEPTGVGVLAAIGVAPALAVLLIALAYVGRLLGAMQGAALELHGGLRGLQPAVPLTTPDPDHD